MPRLAAAERVRGVSRAQHQRQQRSCRAPRVCPQHVPGGEPAAFAAAAAEQHGAPQADTPHQAGNEEVSRATFSLHSIKQSRPRLFEEEGFYVGKR